MNGTFKVASLLDCKDITLEAVASNLADPILRTSFLGCRVFEILQKHYDLNVTYVYEDPRVTGTVHADIHTLPLPLSVPILDELVPICGIVNRRYGFTLLRPYEKNYRALYSLPFTRRVWTCLYILTVLTSVLFYILACWEKVVTGKKRTYSYFYEFLIVVGAFCQRIPPFKATLWSRRITYFVIFIFTFMIHCYYTSNLLSRFVNDRDTNMSLESLLNSDYKLAMLKNMNVTFSSYLKVSPNPDTDTVIFRKKLPEMTTLKVTKALEEILTCETAVLSDFTTLYPFIRRRFTQEAVCDIVEVNIYSNVKKYLFTSKHFPYIEQFKIGTMRAIEHGLLKRLKSDSSYQPPPCTTPPHVVPCMFLMMQPFVILGTTYILSLIILVLENWHYKRNKEQFLPYLD